MMCQQDVMRLYASYRIAVDPDGVGGACSEPVMTSTAGRFIRRSDLSGCGADLDPRPIGYVYAAGPRRRAIRDVTGCKFIRMDFSR